MIIIIFTLLIILTISLGQFSYFINEKKRFYLSLAWLDFIKTYISILLLIFLPYFLIRNMYSIEFFFVFIGYTLCCTYVIHSDFNSVISKLIFYLRKFYLIIKGILLLFWYWIYIIVNQEIVIQTTFSSTNFLLSQFFISLIVLLFFLIVFVFYAFMVMGIIYELAFFGLELSKDNSLYYSVLYLTMKFSDKTSVVDKYYWTKYFLFLYRDNVRLKNFKYHHLFMAIVLIIFVIFNTNNFNKNFEFLKDKTRKVLIYTSYQSNIKECDLVDKDLLISFVGTNLVSIYNETNNKFSYSKCSSNER